MQVTSISSLSNQSTGALESFSKMRQTFQQLGSALESGNLSNAKEALAQLQKNAPTQASQENSLIGAKMETLSKAVDSGDGKTAQQAYADIKKTMSQRASAGGGPAGGPGKAPSGGTKKASDASDDSSSNQVYDKMDTNKDGVVSMQEEIAYSLTHPQEAEQTSATSNIGTVRRSIDLTA